MIELKDFLSREHFLQHSNAKNLLLENLFNISFLKNYGGEEIKKWEDFQVYFNSKGLLKAWEDPNLLDFLKLNTFSIILSDIIADNSTYYIADKRRQAVYKRSDKNISIGFIESANQNIRRLIETWINMTLPEQDKAFYLGDYGVDIIVSPVDINQQEGSKIVYEKAYPISYENLELNLGGDASLRMIMCEFVYKRNYTIDINSNN